MVFKGISIIIRISRTVNLQKAFSVELSLTTVLDFKYIFKIVAFGPPRKPLMQSVLNNMFVTVKFVLNY